MSKLIPAALAALAFFSAAAVAEPYSYPPGQYYNPGSGSRAVDRNLRHMEQQQWLYQQRQQQQRRDWDAQQRQRDAESSQRQQRINNRLNPQFRGY